MDRFHLASECPFCSPDPARVFLETDVVVGLWDAFPVSPGHALIVTRRHVSNWFEASRIERAAIADSIGRVKELIEAKLKPDGYNVGFNTGQAAGQTIFHLHVHVIPRYRDDVPEPRGGIRGVIPGKATY